MEKVGLRTHIPSNQGRIEPPKAVRGHATHRQQNADVTKYSFQMYFRCVHFVILVPRFLLEWMRSRLQRLS